MACVDGAVAGGMRRRLFLHLPVGAYRPHDCVVPVGARHVARPHQPRWLCRAPHRRTVHEPAGIARVGKAQRSDCHDRDRRGHRSPRVGRTNRDAFGGQVVHDRRLGDSLALVRCRTSSAHVARRLSSGGAGRGPVADAHVQHRAGDVGRPSHRTDLCDHHDPRRGAVTVLAGERRSDARTDVEDTGHPDQTRLRPPSARFVIAVVAGMFIVMYVIVALLRLRYPYELEWIEGGMVNHVAQLRGGQSLYRAPSLTFTPDIYTPLYFVVAAVVSFVTGTGFVALRLVSLLASLVLLAAIAKLAHRETKDPVAGLIAAGLFAACYRISGAWLDIAREDTLCLALLFCGLVVARDARTTRRGVAAGVLVS